MTQPHSSVAAHVSPSTKVLALASGRWQVKLPVTAASAVPDHEAYIPVFHRWLRENVLGSLGELLIDVADYRHVWRGPGVMLVGHELDLRMDQATGTLGLLVVRKARLISSGPVLGAQLEGAAGQAKALEQATHTLLSTVTAALTAAQVLEAEPTLEGLRFDRATAHVGVNDRLVPPGAETSEVLAPALAAAARRLWPSGDGQADTDFSTTAKPFGGAAWGVALASQRAVGESHSAPLGSAKTHQALAHDAYVGGSNLQTGV